MQFESLKVTTEHQGRVVHLCFDHGKANEMGSAQLRELEALTAWLAESGAVALVTTSRRVSSKGTPIFVAGANVTERVGWDEAKVKAHVRWQRSVLAGLAAAPVFHVAVVDGVALGWGTEYTLTADWVLACDGATFGLPETGLGILPGAGGTSELWARVGPNQALRLGMTGERIDADEAFRIGLAQERVATVEDGLRRAAALAELVTRRSPTAVAAFKRGVLASIGTDRAARTEIEARAYERCVDSGEAAIGRSSFDTVRAGGTPSWGPRTLEG
ncbi:MAG: enoyl-CoA hydratase/isomerase family protein [Alphaproteobacteria bacterium]|nr:enoyl-CoA hydratase/isomerase family protein [Alphaproteobacteria bacterium]